MKDSQEIEELLEMLDSKLHDLSQKLEIPKSGKDAPLAADTESLEAYAKRLLVFVQVKHDIDLAWKCFAHIGHNIPKLNPVSQESVVVKPILKVG